MMGGLYRLVGRWNKVRVREVPRGWVKSGIYISDIRPRGKSTYFVSHKLGVDTVR